MKQMKSADPQPSNLFFSDQSYFYKVATWWDIGECGTMLVFYYRDNCPHDINFKIYSLLAYPYSTLKRPFAELYKKGNTREKTLDINDAEFDMHGWVTFEGEVYIDIPKWHTVDNMVSTNWREVDKFTTEFNTIVKRIIYEAIEINSQIAEESNSLEIDFEKENPYIKSGNIDSIKSSSKTNETTDKDKASPWGCLIIIILLIAWLIFK